MLTFLTPSALFGLSLLAIPIIVHLLKPRKVRQTPFSSLRWLHLTQQRLSRRFRWHQLLLFLLRAAFIVLLVLSAAKPFLDQHAATGPRERFVILDTSRSMGYQVNDRPTPLDAGKLAAAKLLSSGGVADRTALITVGVSAKLLGAPAPGGEQHIPKLAPLVAESADTHLDEALELVRVLLTRRRPEARIELLVVTDSHQGSWRADAIESFLAEFPALVDTTIVNVAERGARNGWVADARFVSAEQGESAAIDVQLRASGVGGERSVRLLGATGLNERSQTVTLDPHLPTLVRFELRADFDPRGKACEVVLDPPDALPSDDRWYLSLDQDAALDVLVIEGRNRLGSAAAPGFALRSAILSLASSQQPIQVVAKRYNEVQPSDFASVDVVVCGDVAELSDVVVDQLVERVRHGLGLGLFLGPNVDVAFCNQRLIDPLDRTRSLLPGRLGSVVDVPQSVGGLAALDGLAWNHPLLSGLFDPVLGDLAQVGVRSYYRFAGPVAEGATVLATIAGSPAIIDHPVGMGKVVLFNLTLDDAWSDLPRRKSFVPLVDRLLNHLSGGVLQRSFTTDRAITLTLPRLAEEESLTLVGPDAATRTPTITTTQTGTRLSLAPPHLPGVYHVRHGGVAAHETLFTVQVSRGDSVVTPIDHELQRAWWREATCELVNGDSLNTPALDNRASLVTWAILLAALVFMVETLLVHRLCPQMNPPLATSIVRRPSPPTEFSGVEPNGTPLSNAPTL